MSKRPRPRRPYGAVAQNRLRAVERDTLPKYRLSWRWKAKLFLGWATPQWWYNYRHHRDMKRLSAYLAKHKEEATSE